MEKIGKITIYQIPCNDRIVIFDNDLRCRFPFVLFKFVHERKVVFMMGCLNDDSDKSRKLCP